MKALLIIVTTLSIAASRNYAQTGKIEFRFLHCVGNQELIPDSNYVNVFNESFSVYKFRYYISNIGCAGPAPVRESCFLIDHATPSSRTISITVPAGEYDHMEFLLGVDSLHNVSGAQTGALDPLNDMFWTWNTGYVMAKLEGNSSVSNLPQRMMEYHIGGFRGQYSVLKQVQLFPEKREKIKVQNNKTTVVLIRVDLLKWFSGKHSMKIADHPACTSPGALALKYAENYMNMFSIETVKQP